MNKRNVCRTSTILSGLLAIILYTRPYTIGGQMSADNLLGVALGLLSAIFGSQWIEYQKRQDTVAVQPAWPVWLRRLLFGGLLLLSQLNASAQTT